MKNPLLITCFLIAFHSSFGQVNYGKPEEDAMAIQKNFQIWWNYQSKNILLSSDFIALDTSSKEISKESFLNQLTTGDFLPIKLTATNSQIYYQLFKIEPNTDSSIKATITSLSIEEYEHYKMEGTPFPEFSFTDLNGNTITNETINGKIVVIKCWYIHCAACIKEFPAVNSLAAQYKERKDIVFISLAEDTPDQLRTFLAKKPLNYSVIPNMKKYMNETLHLNAFPTHFILDKEGKIAKVLPNCESLEVALDIESKK